MDVWNCEAYVGVCVSVWEIVCIFYIVLVWCIGLVVHGGKYGECGACVECDTVCVV